MNDVIKRVAQAFAGQFAQSAELWEDFVEPARAAIATMREPTATMFMHGGNAEPYNRAKNGRMRGRRIGDLPARDAWRLMIDAALRDT